MSKQKVANHVQLGTTALLEPQSQPQSCVVLVIIARHVLNFLFRVWEARTTRFLGRRPQTAVSRVLQASTAPQEALIVA